MKNVYAINNNIAVLTFENDFMFVKSQNLNKLKKLKYFLCI